MVEGVDVQPAAQAGAGNENVQADNERVRKITRKQTLDGKQYSPEELKQVLCQRARKSAAPKWWAKLKVRIITVEETLHAETVRYDKCTVECIDCSYTHGGLTINPCNFSKTHFDNCGTQPVCKKHQKTGASRYDSSELAQHAS